MTIESQSSEVKRISVNGISVEIVRKDIKNLHLGVYPPLGRVRVAAPLVIDDEAVRLAVIDKLGWIKRQRTQFSKQPRQSVREMVNGESHFFLGRRYRLRVHEKDAMAHVALRGVATLDLFIRPGANIEKRQEVLMKWYRSELRSRISELLAYWQSTLGIQSAAWGVKRMKTKWGSCNVEAKRIWLNLELVKKPEQCIEYIVVHELLHFLERNHSQRFVALMDLHLPDWRARRQLLNSAPLGHESFTRVAP